MKFKPAYFVGGLIIVGVMRIAGLPVSIAVAIVLVLIVLYIVGGGIPKPQPQRRRRVGKSSRAALLNRQKRRCAVCRGRLLEERYHIDHVKPLALGGSNSPQNLQALCPNCHDLKTRADIRAIATARKRR